MVRCPSNNAITNPINYIEISWFGLLNKKPVNRVGLWAADHLLLSYKWTLVIGLQGKILLTNQIRWKVEPWLGAQGDGHLPLLC